MNKTIDARLHSLLNVCKYFTVIYTEAYDSNQLSIKMCLQHFLPKRVTFLSDYNPERVCCFHLRDFNWPLKM